MKGDSLPPKERCRNRHNNAEMKEVLGPPKKGSELMNEKELSRAAAERIARENFGNSRQEIRRLQLEYKKDIVFEALLMLGHGIAQVSDWVDEIDAGRPGDLIREFHEANEPVGPPSVHRAPEGGYGDECSDEALSRIMAKAGLE